MTATSDTTYDAAALREALETDGIVALPGAFSRDWARRMRADVEREFAAAIDREGGAVGRGPKRYYVEIHPEALHGFVELVSHPWVRTVCETVLGPDYHVVELGFDVPFPGAMDQPWHRDFPSPPETYEGRRLTSLAFNLTGVDVVPEMGPFEIAVGTQWESGLDFDHGMFPDRSTWPRYAALAQQKMPRMGDVSARSALTLHRGTAHHGSTPRPVLVLGVDAPGAGHTEFHDLQLTQAYADGLAPEVLAHLDHRIVEVLEPIVQQHTIEGLVMGES